MQSIAARRPHSRTAQSLERNSACFDKAEQAQGNSFLFECRRLLDEYGNATAGRMDSDIGLAN